MIARVSTAGVATASRRELPEYVPDLHKAVTTCAFQPIPLSTSFPIMEPVSTLACAFRRFSAVSGP
jgi:hypothetical protein